MSKADHNKVTHLYDQGTVKEEAGAWLVRIDRGELEQQEITELRAWLARSNFHREYLEKLAHNWDAMAVLQELADIFPLDAKEPTLPEADGNNRGGWPLRWVGFTAVAASVLLLVVFLVPGLDPDVNADEYVTRIGERAEWQLPDGSHMHMNTDSRIETDFSGDLRIVRLLHGEASFDVAKNPSRPFVVYAGEGMVWAVGTAFNVRYTSDLVDVVVTEGAVKVYAEATHGDPGNPASLLTPKREPVTGPVVKEVLATAGQSVRYAGTIQDYQTAPTEDFERRLAWQEDSLVFQGETLEWALREIGRYTSKELVILDEDIKALQVGGHFKTDDIDGLLESLGRGFNLRVSQIGDDRIELSSP